MIEKDIIFKLLKEKLSLKSWPFETYACQKYGDAIIKEVINYLTDNDKTMLYNILTKKQISNEEKEFKKIYTEFIKETGNEIWHYSHLGNPYGKGFDVGLANGTGRSAR